MRRLLLLLILVTMPPAANAQHHRNRHIGAATIGVQIINPDDFNSALTSNYKPLDNTMFAAGGMGLTLHRRFLIGADALGMLGKRNTTTDGLLTLVRVAATL